MHFFAVLTTTHSLTGARYAAERQAWEHDRSDWEHWRKRLQEDLDAARALAGLDARKGLSAVLAEAEARAAAERAALERCVHATGLRSASCGTPAYRTRCRLPGLCGAFASSNTDPQPFSLHQVLEIAA